MEKLDQLLKAVEGVGSLLILPHNDPDPDAIASALALAALLRDRAGISSRIRYEGMVGRAENQALVRYLKCPLKRLKAKDLNGPEPLALVDTQPGAGNNPLTALHRPLIVFDHHPWREASGHVPFSDVRTGVGSTSAILVEYLRVAEIDIPAPLATALFYGIKTDTAGLVRGASPTDIAAHSFLQSRIDVDALIKIETAQVPQVYFQGLDAALHSARVYKRAIVSYLGAMQRPDMAAEMADLLLRLRGMQWAICMGTHGEKLILAVRSRAGQPGAGRMVQAVIDDEGMAGGHGAMAAGQIPLRGAEPEQMAWELAERALAYLEMGADGDWKPLLGQTGPGPHGCDENNLFPSEES